MEEKIKKIRHVWLDPDASKMSTRAKNCLVQGGLWSLKILKKENPTFEDLLQINNCGEKTAREIVNFIKTI